jgi:hypothetical protein
MEYLQLAARLIAAVAAVVVGLLSIALSRPDATAPDLWLDRPVPAAVPIGETDIPRHDEAGGPDVTQVMFSGPGGALIEAVLSRPSGNRARLLLTILAERERYNSPIESR